MDGDSVLVAHEGSLDRIDPTGSSVRLAGEEYRVCPSDPGTRWQPPLAAEHYHTDRFLARDGVIILADASCGLWLRDLATGSPTMLLSKQGGADTPEWAAGAVTVAAEDGSDIVICFDARHADRTTTEVWSVARDGSEHHRIAALPGDARCGALLADATAVFVATPESASVPSSRDVIYRVDRDDGAVTRLADASRLAGLAQDHDALYFIDDGDVVRVTKGSRMLTTLEAASARTHVEGMTRLGSTASSTLVVDGAFLYWVGTRMTGTDFRNTIERMPIAGGEPETVYDVLGSSPRDRLWAEPGIALRGEHVYFGWWRMDPSDAFSIARVAK